MHDVCAYNIGKKLYMDEDNRCLCKSARYRRKTKITYRTASKSKSPNVQIKLSNHFNKAFICVYKGLDHKINYCHYCLCMDIEKNPGPSNPIDPSKSIHAPCCQGDVSVFGQNAGQQCVAMTLCALIYKETTPINSSAPLIKILSIGNELYSLLSRLHNQ